MQDVVCVPLTGTGTEEDPIRPDFGLAKVRGFVVIASGGGKAACLVKLEAAERLKLVEAADTGRLKERYDRRKQWLRE